MEYKVKSYTVNNKVNSYADKSNNIHPKDVHEKPSIVYGMITTKEAARYVPVTQSVILR